MAPTRSNATQNVIFAFNDKELLFCVGISIKQVKKSINDANIIFQLQHDGNMEYHHFRIAMTRDGVLDIVEQ